MSAFDALEKRMLDLSLAGASDSPERVVVVGVFTTAPAESHNGAYGQFGEPAKAAAGGAGYTRSRITFNTQATGGGTSGSASTTSNTQAVTITGLPAGTYTHFGLFGSSTAGA